MVSIAVYQAKNIEQLRKMNTTQLIVRLEHISLQIANLNKRLALVKVNTDLAQAEIDLIKDNHSLDTIDDISSHTALSNLLAEMQATYEDPLQWLSALIRERDEIKQDFIALNAELADINAIVKTRRAGESGKYSLLASSTIISACTIVMLVSAQNAKAYSLVVVIALIAVTALIIAYDHYKPKQKSDYAE